MTAPAQALAVFVADTRTGRVLNTSLPYVSVPSAGYRINSEGPLSFSVPMSADFNRTQIADYLYPWKYSFGVRFGAFILQYGPLTVNPEYDPQSETWSFDCAGIWALFNKKRLLLTARDYPAMSRFDVFRGLLENDLTQINGDLPIDVPLADGVAGPGASYPAGKFSPIGELLRDQTDAGDVSLEAEFRPYFPDQTTMSYVRYRLDLAPYLGRQSFTHRWTSQGSLVMAAPIGGGERIADVYVVPGQSDGTTVLSGQYDVSASLSDGLQNQGWPLLMDLDTTHTSSDSVDDLNSYALGNYNAFHRGARVVKARVRLDPREGTGPRVVDWNLGDYGAFSVVGYLGLPDGTYVCRIIGATLVTLEEADLELVLVSELVDAAAPAGAPPGVPRRSQTATDEISKLRAETSELRQTFYGVVRV
jgi:hypothetical protein